MLQKSPTVGTLSGTASSGREPINGECSVSSDSFHRQNIHRQNIQRSVRSSCHIAGALRVFVSLPLLKVRLYIVGGGTCMLLAALSLFSVALRCPQLR
jgi:hypothetical protein